MSKELYVARNIVRRIKNLTQVTGALGIIVEGDTQPQNESFIKLLKMLSPQINQANAEQGNVIEYGKCSMYIGCQLITDKPIFRHEHQIIVPLALFLSGMPQSASLAVHEMMASQRSDTLDALAKIKG